MSEEKAFLMVNSNYLLPSTRIRILSLEYTSLPPSLHCSVRALGVQVEEQNTYYDDIADITYLNESFYTTNRKSY